MILAAATLASILALVAMVNVVVDPYRVFDIVDKAGFNARKPRAMEHGYLSKLASIASIRPERIVLGNSRAQVGLDPKSAQWGDSLTTYNAALPGTGLDTMLSLMHAGVAAGRLREAIVGLDFLDFLVDDQMTPADVTSSNPIAVDPPNGALSPRPGDVKTALALTVSLDALLDSAYTLASQHSDDLPDLTRLGFTPMRDYLAMAKRDGYADFFAQRDAENAAAFVRKPKALFYAKSRTSPDWQRLQEIKNICRQLQRGCTFIIYPYHAHILVLFAQADLWSEFEDWKRELVRRLDPAPISGRDSKLVLWDFSGYSRYACERVPVRGDRSTVMQWYWEAGHFKRELGDRIIARIMGDGDPDFGVRLGASTLEPVLLRIRQGQQRYRDENKTDVSALEKLVSEHRRPVS